MKRKYRNTIIAAIFAALLGSVLIGHTANVEVEPSKSATKGTAAASFVNPAPSTAVVSGVGTSSFSWGVGQPSQLSFTPKFFNPKPNEVFSIGTLDYFNGVIFSGTGAST